MAIDKTKLIPTGMVYSRTGKLPLENDRLFDTLALAQAYVDNVDKEAYVGLTISVTADTEENNGYYYVKAIGTADAPGELIKLGAGSGSTAVDNFVVGEDGKIEGAVNPGQVIYVTEGSEQYPAGPYIVTGDGTVAKLGTTTATGDIAGDVETLKGDMSTVKGEVNTLKSSVESLESGKVSVDEFNSAKGELTQAVADEKSAREEAIQGVQDQVTANAQAIEALNAATTFGGTGTYEQMQALTDVKAGTVWVISGDESYANKEFVYDGTQWVELGDTTAEAQRISTLEGEMSQAKTDISGLQESLSNKVESEEGKGLSSNDFTDELKAKLDGIAEGAQVNVLEGVQVDGVDLTVTDKKVNIDLSAFAKTEEVNSAIGGINNSLAAKLDKTATVNGKAFNESQAVVIGSGDIKLGNNIGTEANPDRYTTEDSIQGVLESMNDRIESIDADIQSALEGGVTGIEQGNGIAVDTTTATKPKVSIKLAAVNPGLQATADGLAAKVATGTALKVDENGLGIYWESL